MPPIVPRRIERVFAGRVLTLQRELIDLPRGGELLAEIIRHPGSVVIVPVTDDGQLVLVRQYRHAIGAWVWELPAGSLKAGENPRAAAARECQEEVGLIPSSIEKLGELFPTPGYCDERMTFYLARGLRAPRADDPEAHQDDDEDIESKAFPIDRVRALVASGEIVDMKTVAGLALLTDEALRLPASSAPR